ncbi:hypothetical protein GCM10010193_61580 [Kitasatospora atroaurantiaca]
MQCAGPPHEGNARPDLWIPRMRTLRGSTSVHLLRPAFPWHYALPVHRPRAPTLHVGPVRNPPNNDFCNAAPANGTTAPTHLHHTAPIAITGPSSARALPGPVHRVRPGPWAGHRRRGERTDS